MIEAVTSTVPHPKKLTVCSEGTPERLVSAGETQTLKANSSHAKVYYICAHCQQQVPNYLGKFHCSNSP